MDVVEPSIEDIYSNENVPDVCQKLYRDYTADGDLSNENRYDLLRCMYTRNKPNCNDMYDNYMRDPDVGNQNPANFGEEELEYLKECSGPGVVEQAYIYSKIAGDKVWDGVKWVSGKGLEIGSVVGTSIWNGVKWVSGKGLQAGTQAAGKVWDGTKWVATQAVQGVKAAAQYVSSPILRYIVYMFLIAQVLIEGFGTFSDLVDVKRSFGTQMIVILLTIVQIVFAGGLIRFKITSIDIASWIGMLYFGSILVGSLASGGLKAMQIWNAEDTEKSQLFNYLGLLAKAIKLIVALIFGGMFMFSRDESGGKLKMYGILAVAIPELVIQILKLLGLN